MLDWFKMEMNLTPLTTLTDYTYSFTHIETKWLNPSNPTSPSSNSRLINNPLVLGGWKW